jgi:hypothetical protein
MGPARFSGPIATDSDPDPRLYRRITGESVRRSKQVTLLPPQVAKKRQGLPIMIRQVLCRFKLPVDKVISVPFACDNQFHPVVSADLVRLWNEQNRSGCWKSAHLLPFRKPHSFCLSRPTAKKFHHLRFIAWGGWIMKPRLPLAVSLIFSHPTKYLPTTRLQNSSKSAAHLNLRDYLGSWLPNRSV